MQGWIKLNRSITEHWIWTNEKYLKYWLIILLKVNHEAKKFTVGAALHTCYPGQSYRSIQHWTNLFGCSKKTTVKLFDLLEKEDMIYTEILGKGNQRKHLLTVTNWDKYQGVETEKLLSKKPESYSQRNRKVTPNKNEKNEKNENNTYTNSINPKSQPQKSSKTKSKFVPPTIDEVKSYFHEKGFKSEIAEKAYEYYESANWIDSRGNKIKNWKQKMIGVWFRPENSTIQPNEPRTRKKEILL